MKAAPFYRHHARDPQKVAALLNAQSPELSGPETIRKRIALAVEIGDAVAKARWDNALSLANERIARRVQEWRRRKAT